MFDSTWGFNKPKAEQDLIFCENYRLLDEKFHTDRVSPLHHDNRCPIHRIDYID